MPRIHEPAQIRALLQSDRDWGAYALGDLDPVFFKNCEWYAVKDSIALLYKGFDSPLLFTLGEKADLTELFREISHEPRLYLSIRQESMDLLLEHYDVSEEEHMFRMTLRDAPAAPSSSDCVRLDLSNFDEMSRLFADGEPRGEVPQFFDTNMVEHGLFFGTFENGALTAVAGTHILAAQESVAAIGCVYTKFTHRGRGLSRTVTNRVVMELLKRNIETIVLNVRQTNSPAIRVYEQIGFVRCCPFYEGVAIRKG